jgi:hypothetical protein
MMIHLRTSNKERKKQMCLLELKKSCPLCEGICEGRKSDSSYSGISKIILFFHINYLLQYKYFDGWGKGIFSGVKGCGRNQL